MENKQPDLNPAATWVDEKKAEYTEILLRLVKDLYAAAEAAPGTDGRISRAPIIVALEDGIEELQHRLKMERDENRVARYSDPPLAFPASTVLPVDPPKPEPKVPTPTESQTRPRRANGKRR